MTTITAEQAKALLDGATEGPWLTISRGQNELDAPKYNSGECLVMSEDCEHHPVADCSCNHSCRMDYECEANARLIAAAPDAMETIIAQAARIAELEAERLAADFKLVDRYRAPKTGSFVFPDDVAKIVRALDAANAEIARLKARLEDKEYRE